MLRDHALSNELSRTQPPIMAGGAHQKKAINGGNQMDDDNPTRRRSRTSSSITLETIPSCVLINDILPYLDLQSLSSLACVSTALHSSVSQSLSSLCFLNISDFSPDVQTLKSILSRCGQLTSVTLNCLRIPSDSSIRVLLNPPIQELVLLSCSNLSSQVLAFVGDNCPNLRMLIVEMTHCDTHEVFRDNLIHLLGGCLKLETLCLKIRGSEDCPYAFSYTGVLQKRIKFLKLQPLQERDAISLVKELTIDTNVVKSSNSVQPISIAFSPFSSLQSLSLVLDIISDELVMCITNCVPHLVELDLEDRPSKETMLSHDLTNAGFSSLGSCSNLKSLFITRSRHNYPATFKRVNDVGMFLLFEGCKYLEWVRLGGFSKVSDAGFATILHSCCNLKKLEVRNAPLLSDLAFHNLTEAPCSLTELRLWSCNLITSETVKKLASSNSLEVLDLNGCWSIADPSIYSVSSLGKLTLLDLGGADITDSGLSALSEGSLPIGRLSLRGCKRVTDKGVIDLLHGGGMIRKTLSSLDLGHMPGITDRAVCTIAKAGGAVTELCIRSCFYVTDSSIEALSQKESFQDGNRPLCKIDVYSCLGLSQKSLWKLRRPLFRGLRWIGVGHTQLTCKGDGGFAEIHEERPWLTVCMDGCEMGCRDGWQFHGNV